MPAHRKPDALHKARGTYRPDRHGGNNPATAPAAEGVGDAPPHLSPEAADVWRQLAGVAWWLTPADSAALAVACIALVAIRSDPTAALLSASSRALGDLGLSPRARGAVVGLAPSPPVKAAADPLGEFGVAAP